MSLHYSVWEARVGPWNIAMPLGKSYGAGGGLFPVDTFPQHRAVQQVSLVTPAMQSGNRWPRRSHVLLGQCLSLLPTESETPSCLGVFAKCLTGSPQVGEAWSSAHIHSTPSHSGSQAPDLPPLQIKSSA